MTYILRHFLRVNSGCSLNIADDDRMGILIFGGTQAPFGTRCTNRVSLFTEYKGKLKYKELKTTGVAPIPQYGSVRIFSRLGVKHFQTLIEGIFSVFNL